MAKLCMINRNQKRKTLCKSYANRRAKLKAVTKDPNISAEDKFQAQLKLAELPRNSSKVRVRNRCELTGRPRGVYRKFGLGRSKLRELASKGLIPGIVKSSW